MFESPKSSKSGPKKIVLAYSGGLDTSVMLHWLKAKYNCEIIAYTADVGQGEELAGLEAKAIRTGASKLVVADLKKEFVEDFIWTALKSGAVYEGVYLLGTSLARPIIAKRQVDIARAEGADAVAHGATGKGNDQVRFELTYYSQQPDIRVLAPWRDWEFKSRTDLINYAAHHQIPVVATAEKPYSTDRNLMHVSYEGGILEDPWFEPPEDIFRLTRSIDKTPASARYVEVGFEKGVPVSVDGVQLDSVSLLTSLNDIGGEHGIGRVDLVENRYVGMKSRGVYETPGMTILHAAHRAVESLTLDREVLRLRDANSVRIAEMMYYGYWYSPEFQAMKAFVDATQETVTGVARLKLHRGAAQVVGRRSPLSLYSQAHVTFETDHVYNQADAEGFIRLNALRLRLGAQRKRAADANQGG